VIGSCLSLLGEEDVVDLGIAVEHVPHVHRIDETFVRDLLVDDHTELLAVVPAPHEVSYADMHPLFPTSSGVSSSSSRRVSSRCSCRRCESFVDHKTTQQSSLVSDLSITIPMRRESIPQRFFVTTRLPGAMS